MTDLGECDGLLSILETRLPGMSDGLDTGDLASLARSRASSWARGRGFEAIPGEGAPLRDGHPRGSREGIGRPGERLPERGAATRGAPSGGPREWPLRQGRELSDSV